MMWLWAISQAQEQILLNILLWVTKSGVPGSTGKECCHSTFFFFFFCTFLVLWQTILILYNVHVLTAYNSFPQYLHGLPPYFLPSFRRSEVVQSCPTLWDPMDSSLQGSCVHGIFQARVLEWVAISFSRGSSPPRDQTQVSRIARRRFTIWATREAYFLQNFTQISPFRDLFWLFYLNYKTHRYVYTHVNTHTPCTLS